VDRLPLAALDHAGDEAGSRDGDLLRLVGRRREAGGVTRRPETREEQ